MANIESFSGNEQLSEEQRLLSPAIAHYIRRLIRQNLDQLKLCTPNGGQSKADPLSDLNALLTTRYLKPTELSAVALDLERLTLAHQALSGQGSIYQQEIESFEQAIFKLLGFEQQVNPLQATILIVDDTPENLRLLSAALTQRGYDVRSAISGTIALTGALNIMPDLILLDIMMPDMTGYEVCEKLKADPLTRDIPIIFVSAVDEVSDKVKAFRMGGVDYVTKPFQLEEVIVRIQNQINLHQLQKRLEEQNVRLQTEMRNRQQAEENALQALAREKEYSELRSRFVSMVSHEFRTPLTMIQSCADLLEYYDLSKVEKRERLQQIREAVQHMAHLIDDVLLIGEAETGRFQMKPTLFEVVQFCRDLVVEIQLTIGSKHRIKFLSAADPHQAKLDQKLLRHILYNLLSNAIKYSPKGSNIEVNLRCQADQIILQVRDEGIGIPPEDQHRLFDTFHRATNATKIPGSGLGLAIVKRCVDLQGGHIAVQSEVGVGTLFTVTLVQQAVEGE
jgi:signal transduction histidine kinase